MPHWPTPGGGGGGGEVVTLTTIAGDPYNSGTADGTGSGATFDSPLGLALNAAGNIVVGSETVGNVRLVTPAGVVTTLLDASIDEGQWLVMDTATDEAIVQIRNVDAHLRVTMAGGETVEGDEFSTSTGATHIAIDSVGELWVTAGDAINNYDAGHNFLGSIDNAPAGTVTNPLNIGPVCFVGDDMIRGFNMDSADAEIWRFAPPYTSGTMIVAIPSLSGTSYINDVQSIGSTLFFTGGDGDGSYLYRVSASGGTPTRLTGTGYSHTDGTPGSFDTAYGIAIASTSTIYVSDFADTVRRVSIA